MRYFVFGSALLLAGCGQLGIMGSKMGTPVPPTDVAAIDPMIGVQTVQEDTVTPRMRPAVFPKPVKAVAPPPRRAKLELPPEAKPEPVLSSFGTTVASLGNVGEQGLWIKTPLVKTEQQGKVTAANGTTVEMTLIPLDGPKTGGSRLSLAAMQALGVGITSLPEVVVAPL